MEITIDQALQKAIEEHKAGRVQEAERLYTAILKAQPNHPDANHNLGVLTVSVGKANEALPFLKTALNANPSIAQFWLSFIDALIKLNRITDAEAVLDQVKSKGAKGDGFDKLEQRLQKIGKVILKADQIAEERQPQKVNILDSIRLDQAIKLAKKKERDGETEEAKLIYRDVLSKFPKNRRAKEGLKGLAHYSIETISTVQDPFQDQVQSLINLYSKGQLEQAINYCDTLLKNYPNSATLFNIQGAVFKGLGQLDLSVDAYKKALSIKPDYAEAYNNIGITLQEQGKLDGAIEAYEKALVIKPDYAEAYYNMGKVLNALGRLEEAIKAYEKALAIKPDHAEAFNNMGNTLKQQGKLDEAIEAYQKALVIKPDHAEAFNNMGISLQEQGKMDKAIEAFEKALVIKPDYAEAYNNMGYTLKQQEKLDEGMEAYKKALSIKPDYAAAYSNMGNALKEQGKLDDAIRAYEKALAIKPDYAEAYNNMGVTKHEQGQLKEALVAYNKAIAIESHVAEFYNNMGVTQQEQGLLEEAIETYKKAIALRPDYAEVIENMQNLAVQLLPIIAVHNYDFDNSVALVNSEINSSPKYQIQNVIKAYLEGDFFQAALHNNNFKVGSQNLSERLNPKDVVFCNAYSNFIAKLLDANWDLEYVFEDKVYHLGESHSLSYAHRNIKIGDSSFKIAPRMTFGAKAFHFCRTKYDEYKAITKAHFESLPPGSMVFLSFGEIDCRPNEGFISAAKKYAKPLKMLINQTVEGYVRWFSDLNQEERHDLYFFNVPAPCYNKNHSIDLNSEVARTVLLFNKALKQYSLQHGFDIVDVYDFTVGNAGFSNGLFHVDDHHLGAKALVEIQKQLS